MTRSRTRNVPLVHGKLNGKYRNLLIPFDALFAEAQELAADLESLRQQHESGRLGDAELTLRFILLFAGHRSGRDAAKADLTAVARLQIPGMPGMIFIILADWFADKVDLRLTEKPVPALEMLRAQAEGWRYVTVSFRHALAGELIEGTRDAFEFALHDLGHAYAFFKADYYPQGQMEFFKALLNDLETLAPFAEADTKFAADLEYCMADMNSHPQHLRQYLRGVIVEMFLRRSGGTEYEAELQSLLAKLVCLAPNPGPSPKSGGREHSFPSPDLGRG
jgi:hypothetical protein